MNFIYEKMYFSPTFLHFFIPNLLTFLHFLAYNENMYRKIVKKMAKWKNSPYRKPLVLQGARQIGKTFAANEFGRLEYDNTVYFNFEKDENLKNLFTELYPAALVPKLEYFKKTKIAPKHTLIIFDEIQACPAAIASLKYFFEEANQYHVIALGSLLGVAANREEFSFPVGKVDFMTMSPMDFEEYLLARGDDFLIERIFDSYQKFSPMEFHEQALQIYKEYLLVGGMPEVVRIFLETKNFELVREKQTDIIQGYFNDMSKYNRQTEIPKTRLLYKNMNICLSKENKKFMYKCIKNNARSSEYENAVQWLSMAGIACQVHRLEQIRLPLEAYKSLSDFKFYMNDVGLCSGSMNILPQDVFGEEPAFADFKGGLTENYICNALENNGHKLFYWTSGNQAEVDFVTRIEDDIIPIETKSNKNTRSKSLAEYAKRYSPKYAIRFSQKNFGFENGIKSIPLYAAYIL